MGAGGALLDPADVQDSAGEIDLVPTQVDQFAGSEAFVTDHVMLLSGLRPRTQYSYRIRCRSKAGRELISPDGRFVTGAAGLGVAPAVGLILLVSCVLALAVGLVALDKLGLR